MHYKKEKVKCRIETIDELVLEAKFIDSIEGRLKYDWED